MHADLVGMIGSESDPVSDCAHYTWSKSGTVVAHRAVFLERPNVIETKIVSHDVNNMRCLRDHIRSRKEHREHVG